MILSVDRGLFLKALSHGQSVVERRTTIPILSHVLLVASTAKLSLTTTDMDLALIETIPADVSKPGNTTVSAHMLFDIVRKLPEGSQIELSLDAETGQLHLKAGRSRFRLPCLPFEDFPQLTQGELPHKFTLKTTALKKLLDRARFAMSTEETRYYLNGIHFHTLERDGVPLLRAVATDAHRLAYIETPLPEGAKGMPGIIIGRKTVTEVRKLLDEIGQEVTISLSPSRIEFALETAVLSSRLIDGTFPDYEQAIPFSNDKILIFESKSFASAVDRVATVATDKAKIIKVTLTPNSLSLSVVSQEMGSADEEMAVDYPHEETIEIGFNAKYLLDIAQQIEEDETQMILADGDSPAIIRGVNETESTYVLMPMRV